MTECSDHDPPSIERRLGESEVAITSANDSFSVSNRFVADRPTVHLVDVPATGISGPQASATMRLPRAAQLLSVDELPRVVATEVDPHDMSLVLQSLVGRPSTPRSRLSSAIKALLVICVIGTPLAFIFMFASAPHQIDLESMWRALPIGTAETPPAESEGFAVRTGSDSEVQTQLVGMTTRSDTVPNAVKTRARASPTPPAIELKTTDNSLASPKEVVMPDVSFDGKLRHLREAQTGVWTYCAVNLIPNGQIAVQRAMTYHTCISAGKKCAGRRRYADIQFFDRPTLTSKVPLELCHNES